MTWDGMVAEWIMAVLSVIATALLGVMLWFLRRTIVENDRAHDEFRKNIVRLEQKVDTTTARLEQKVDTTTARLEARYDRLEAKVDELVTVVAGMAADMAWLRGRLEAQAHDGA